MDSTDEPRMDRTAFSVAHTGDPDDTAAYWLTRPVSERLNAIELLRRTFYGEDYDSQGLQGFFEVAEREPR